MRLSRPQSKFIKFLSLLKQQISFSTNLYTFNKSFIYFQQKEPNKVQIWWNFIRVVESLKFYTLTGSFCTNHIKFQLEKYRRVIFNDTEEWCKAYASLWVMLSNGEFSPNHSKVRQFYFNWLFLSKVHTEQWCKIWINPNLWFQKWHEESGELSLEHSKVWKIVLWWALFVQSI